MEYPTDPKEWAVIQSGVVIVSVYLLNLIVWGTPQKIVW